MVCVVSLISTCANVDIIPGLCWMLCLYVYYKLFFSQIVYLLHVVHYFLTLINIYEFSWLLLLIYSHHWHGTRTVRSLHVCFANGIDSLVFSWIERCFSSHTCKTSAMNFGCTRPVPNGLNSSSRGSFVCLKYNLAFTITFTLTK